MSKLTQHELKWTGVRLPAEMHRELGITAKQHGTTMQALLLRGAELILSQLRKGKAA